MEKLLSITPYSDARTDSVPAEAADLKHPFFHTCPSRLLCWSLPQIQPSLSRDNLGPCALRNKPQFKFNYNAGKQLGL